MPILVCSTSVVFREGDFYDELIESLKRTHHSENCPVVFLSNQPKPDWFEEKLGVAGIFFIPAPGRQNGQILKDLVATLKDGGGTFEPHDILVLASKEEDIHMGKNGCGVLVAAGWSKNQHVKNLGIKVDSAAELEQVIQLLSDWNGNWWYRVEHEALQVKSLANLSSRGGTVTENQERFARAITTTVKQGGVRLNALLAITARSLLADGLATEKNLLWGVYPSSSSDNKDKEVLSDFTHRLRTTTCRSKFATRDNPLFIRHKASSKRSKSSVVNRMCPREQIESLHLNPAYKGKLRGRKAIIIDDCTTYGVSFCVARALLLRAGVSSVTGLALGKFGNQLYHFDINIVSDPFAPIGSDGYNVGGNVHLPGRISPEVQSKLLGILEI
ncbi:MAG: phosphoribosyltransferase [Candidatus Sericytochromatia bacterium]